MPVNLDNVNKIISIAKSWKTITSIGAIAGTILTLNQLNDYYWNRIDNLVKGSIKQSTLLVVNQLEKSERRMGDFLIDDLKFRIICVEDEIADYRRRNKPVPIYLERKLNLLEDQYAEAKEKWGN